MGKILTRILTLAAIIAATTACNTTGCLENQSSIPLAGFYSHATKEPIAVDSVAIQGVGTDSLLYDPATPLQQIYLPLRATATYTAYAIRYCSKALGGGTLADTIHLDYTATPYLASEDCGAMYRYRINTLRHTTLLIDSVGLTDSLITNRNIETLHIYIRTQEGGSQ